VVDANARCRRWLDNPFYRSYGVLTMCRMRYTLQYGVVVSKAMTARWVQAAGLPCADQRPEFLPFDAT